MPEIETENPHEDEDVQDELEVIEENLNDLADEIADTKLFELVSGVDTSKEDFGIYDIQVVVSYICDNFQLERNIIRGRRAILGVYPKTKMVNLLKEQFMNLHMKFQKKRIIMKMRHIVNLKSGFCLKKGI